MSALSVALPSSALEVTIAPSTTAAVGTGSSSLATYTDTADRFTLEVPSDWQQGEGVLGGNSSFSGASGWSLYTHPACRTRACDFKLFAELFCSSNVKETPVTPVYRML